MFILNFIVIKVAGGGVAGSQAVAVLTVGWRIATVAILPLLGIATAVVSVTGAAFGEKNYRKLNTAFMYAIKMGIVIEIVVAVFTFTLAPQITSVFTWSEAIKAFMPFPVP